jgi:hypothetical protein
LPLSSRGKKGKKTRPTASYRAAQIKSLIKKKKKKGLPKKSFFEQPPIKKKQAIDNIYMKKLKVFIFSIFSS